MCVYHVIKKLCLLFCLAHVGCAVYGVLPAAVLVSSPRHHQKTSYAAIRSIFCVVNAQADEALLNYAKVIAYDLTFTDQFHIKRYQSPTFLADHQLDKQFMQGIPLSIELSCMPHQREAQEMHVSIRVRETSSHKIILDMQMTVQKDCLVQEAHACADRLIECLTNRKSITMTSIAYCVQPSAAQKVIMVSDYAGFAVSPVVDDGCLNVAPRWHASLPMIFYSRIKTSLGELCSFDMRTRTTKLVCSYEGLSMQPSCSEDGKRVVLCMSSDKGNLEIYLYDQSVCAQQGRRVFQQLTNNGGSNSSPCFLQNGDVVFCSDFETSLPQLYYLNMKTKVCTRLTGGGKGYCAAPAYNQARNALVYTRYNHADGFFQLFELSLTTRTERQLTHGAGDKLDPAWSPCGNYVACVLDRYDVRSKKKISQIALLNSASNKLHVITKGDEPKSFPVWTNGAYYVMGRHPLYKY